MIFDEASEKAIVKARELMEKLFGEVISTEEYKTNIIQHLQSLQTELQKSDIDLSLKETMHVAKLALNMTLKEFKQQKDQLHIMW